MSLYAKVANDLFAAQTAQTMMSSAMADYQAACLVGDWTRAEESRMIAVSALESFCDNYAAAHKVMNDG